MYATINSTIYSNTHWDSIRPLPKVIQIFRYTSKVRCKRQEGFRRNSYAIFSRSKCSAHTGPPEARRDFCSLSLYQCRELTEYLSTGSVVLETDFSSKGTLI